MLDLIVLIFLTREIGRLAAKKGLRILTWRIYTVISWLLTEIIGIMIGVMIFGPDNLISVALVGITFAVTSYFIIKAYLEKLPDHDDIDIDNFGRNY
jgi:hypothetical protein